MSCGWYPGHMARTRRLIKENLRFVKVILEVADARVPVAGRNPDLGRLVGDKPRLVVLNKEDLADPATTKQWLRHLKSLGEEARAVDALSGRGFSDLEKACRLRSGSSGPTRLIVLGIPNSGKSSLINRLVGRKMAGTGAMAGVTKGKQWVRASEQLEVLDLPGVVSPRRGGRLLTYRLAAVGALDDRACDFLDVALYLLGYEGIAAGLRDLYALEPTGDPHRDIEALGARLGCLSEGGEIDLGRVAYSLMRDFRTGRLGRHSLESPPPKGGQD